MEECVGMGMTPAVHRPRSTAATNRVGPFHVVPLMVLVLLLALTAAVTVITNGLVVNQERKLLAERANEVNLVLTTSITTISTDLSVLAREVARGGPSQFVQEARAQLASSQNPVGLALLRPVGETFTVVASTGPGLQPGQVLSGPPAQAMATAARRSTMVASGVYGSGSARSVGFARGAAGGLVIYRQSMLGAIRPPAQAGSAAFSELRVVVYASARPDASQVLVATTKALPPTGTVRYSPLMAGSTKWLTGVNAVDPLVGSVASAAPWVALAGGLVGSILVFLLLEAMAYRRDSAVEALESEHRFAEALQRRLLPALPTLGGLEVASSYVPGANRQQVGGDWFDVFELPSGEVAVAIGDVMGHDVDAAATMGQVRAALRSYALDGGDPAETLAQLARFVELFGVAAVVTVIYGVLLPPENDGSRQIRWANAGHLPPLLRHPDGRVEELAKPSSPLLGAPSSQPRATEQARLDVNATLLLYTDGLVEVEGQDLGTTVELLKGVLRRAAQPRVQDVCTAILEAQLPGGRRDDVAILVVKISDLPSTGDPTAETATATT
jgi:serine phosphatase RsbU (regulator of sigma subunit)